MFENISWYDPASGNPTISALYTGFSGIQLDSWAAVSDNVLTFVMPSAVDAGYIDVIAFNEAGYGKLTVDAIRPTLNPYVSGTSEYNNYVEYQHPSISGIRVDPFYYYCS